MESQKLDAHLDKVLRAAGSALRHYSFPKSRADMRAALQAALEEAAADEREACAKVCEAQTETGAHKRCAAAIRARNQPRKMEIEMTDHADELRRSSKKLDGVRCTGDVTAVMHAAAAHIEKLERRLHGLEWDVTHWRANHAAEVHRARVLKERPDMPLERVEAYKQIGELLARVAELEAERTERKPIAWYCDGEDGREYNGCPQMSNGRTGTPLYAAPPVAAPVRLTDMQVVKLFQDFNERDGRG